MSAELPTDFETAKIIAKNAAWQAKFLPVAYWHDVVTHLVYRLQATDQGRNNWPAFRAELVRVRDSLNALISTRDEVEAELQQHTEGNQ